MGVPARVWIGVVVAVMVRPALWWPALRQCARLAPRQWWRHAPFLPVPDRGVVAFRLTTAYGEHGTPTVADLLRYLHWCAERD